MLTTVAMAYCVCKFISVNEACYQATTIMTSQGFSLVLRHIDDGCDVGELEHFVLLLAAAEGLFDGVPEVNVDRAVQDEVHREVDHVRNIEHILKESKYTVY